MELSKLYNEKDILNVIKTKRIQWLGQLERMSNERSTKKFFKRRLEGKRKVERPGKRWLDEVEGDLKKLKVSNWKIKAKDSVKQP